LTKNSPLKATGAHISIVGHITTSELRARLNRTDLANGFANRFLFLCVRRSKLLPYGGSVSDDEIKLLGERVRAAVEYARNITQVMMTEQARQAWGVAYRDLSADRPGLLGAVTARAEAQVIRLALLYALIDCKPKIDLDHLRAALALWVRIFGDALGDPVADDIYRGLKHAGDDGMSRTAIRDLFGRHQSGGRIAAALALLATRGRARCKAIATDGRPVETWFAVVGAAAT
jgi:DNA replicative helicase MCM subunit Mcm2 (Cdc46/Mcm family)